MPPPGRPTLKDYDPDFPYRYAHLKRDGNWLRLYKPGRGWKTEATTSLPTDITAQVAAHPVYQAFDSRAFDGLELFCELYAPGRDASQVKHFLAVGDMAALAIDAFASPVVPRDTPLDQVEAIARKAGVPFAPYLDFAGSSFLLSQQMLMVESWRRDPGNSDSEGVVLKDGNLLNWSKLKDEETADLVVTGEFTEGKGHNLGLIGSMWCGLWTPTGVSRLARVSGMTKEVRRYITNNKAAVTGTVVEVKYQRVEEAGGLRHPRFLRWREDKRPEECVSL